MKKKYILLTTILLSAFVTNAQGVWTQRANMIGNEGPSAFSIGTKGYFCTGNTPSSYVNNLWEYDQPTDTWTQRATMPGTARHLGFGFAIGTKGYCGAGNRCCPTNTNFNDFYEWDQATNTWTAKASYPQSVWGAFGFSLNGKGYAGGGVQATTYSNFWEFDPVANAWSPKANFGGGPRREAVAFSIGNLGYVGSGFNGSSTTYNDLWEYNAVTNAWTQRASFPAIARHQSAGFSIGNKGYIGMGGNYLQDFWEWDQASNTWSAIANFPLTGRDRARGFSIGSKGYIGGGTDGVTPFAPTFWEWGSCSTAPAQPGTIAGSTTVCNGSTNTYSISPVSGATSYTWTLPGGWTGTSTTTSINATASATSGNITVTANNACGSSSVQTLAVTVNTVGVSTVPTGLLCNGDNSGSATATPTGTGPFTYLWSNTQTTQTATGLSATSYTVTVTGAGGCTATASVIITQPLVLNANVNSTYTSCGTCCDGSATVMPTGGTPPYTYLWSISQTTQTATGLCNGSYTVCVTDANGCTSCTVTTISFNVSMPDITEKDFSIYPNPFSDILTISDIEGSADIKLFNLLGEVVYYEKITTSPVMVSLSNHDLHTPTLKSGIYLIEITTESGRTTKRIVKE